MMYHKYNQGFTLIEALIAIFIFSVALVSLITITSRGVTGTAQARDQVTAQFLAQEGIELLRNIRDSQIVDPGPDGTLASNLVPACSENAACSIAVNSNNYTLSSAGGFGLEQGGWQYDSVNTGKFTRRLYYKPAQSGGDHLELHSVVTWNNGSIPRVVHLTSIISNWGQHQQP